MIYATRHSVAADAFLASHEVSQALQGIPRRLVGVLVEGAAGVYLTIGQGTKTLGTYPVSSVMLPIDHPFTYDSWRLILEPSAALTAYLFWSYDNVDLV